MSSRKFVAGELAWVPIIRIKLHPDWPYRKKLGSLDDLARSMNGENGQLQAIGINTGGFLVWGLRRFNAAKKLGWTEILCRIVDVPDPMTAMKEENENRLGLTRSEMTAIMRCIEATERVNAKARQGSAGPGSGQGAKPSGSGNISGTAHGEVRDKAAEAFDFSGKTFEAMKAIEDHGTEKLKEAWNADEISTHDAASAATESPEIQDEAVERVRKKTAKTAKAAIQKIKGELETEEMVDDDGFKVPARLRVVFSAVPLFLSVEGKARRLAKQLQEAEQTAAYLAAHQGATGHFLLSTANSTGANKFRGIRPARVHQSCGGDGCEHCLGRGYFTAEEKDTAK